MIHPDKKGIVIFPNHGSAELGKGIEKQSGNKQLFRFMKKTSKKYQVLIEKTDTGFSAMVMDLPVFTTGTSIENLSSNIIEALNLYLEERNEFVDFGNIKLNMDFQLFFQNYKILNVKFLAKRIGINASLLSQYVRGIKSPSQKQISKILNGINEVGEELKDLALINNFTLKKK